MRDGEEKLNIVICWRVLVREWENGECERKLELL